MSVKDEFIASLGIPRTRKCSKCGGTVRRTDGERYILSECMMSNGEGLWALEHCGHCGYVETVYPSKINGIPCTKEECIKLFDELQKEEDEE